MTKPLTLAEAVQALDRAREDLLWSLGEWARPMTKREKLSALSTHRAAVTRIDRMLARAPR